MKKTLLVLSVGLVALFMTSCGKPQQTYDVVCVNPQGNIRIDEDFCEEDDDDFDPNRPHSWLYFPGGKAPAMGSAGTGGLTNAPGNSRTNFLSTDSDSKTKTKPKPTTAPNPTVNLNKPTTQAPKANSQASPPKSNSGTRNSTSGGNRTSGGSSRGR